MLITTIDQTYYVPLINRLRQHFATVPTKKFLITGAPQCPVPDSAMDYMIRNAVFDIVWVQYMNTPYCSAVAWYIANQHYVIGTPENANLFATSWDLWKGVLAAGNSSNAKLWIGLLGSASDGYAGSYMDPTTQLQPLLESRYFCDPKFGGIMIVEAKGADDNKNAAGVPFTQQVKTYLVANSHNTSVFSCATVATTTVIASTPSAPPAAAQTSAATNGVGGPTIGFDAITAPGVGEILTAGKAYTIKWLPSAPFGSVSIILLQGTGDLTLQLGATIASKFFIHFFLLSLMNMEVALQAQQEVWVNLHGRFQQISLDT